MAVLKIRDENNNIIEIPALRGEDGYTPQRGIDYWTESDVAEIQAYIDNKVGSNESTESIVGTWVFNDDLNISRAMDVDVHFASYDTDGIYREFNRIFIDAVTDPSESYIEDYGISYYTDDDYYLVCDTRDEMWVDEKSKTITFFEEPTDEIFTTWLKANATKQGGSSDNADESYTGTWVFNDTINSLPEGIYNLKFTSSGADYVGLKISRLGPPVPILIYSINGNDEGYYVYCFANDYGIEEGWQSASYKTIRIQEEPEQTIKDWLIANATKMPDNVPTLGFSVSTDFPTTVWYVLNYILMSGANLSEFNIINLTGYRNDTISVRYRPYGNGSFGLLEASNLLTLKRISDVADWSTVRIADFLDKFSVNTCFEMPRIRFANFKNDEDIYRFTVENMGGGTLQVGDKLQICCRRKYSNKKIKLRKMAEYILTEEDLNSKFLKIEVDPSDENVWKWLFRNDKYDSGAGTLSAMYFRLKRVTAWNDSGEECNAIFSNVEQVWKTYSTHYEDGEYILNIK